MTTKGIIHIGSNDGREYHGTTRLTLLFEPQAEVFAELEKLHGHNVNIIAFRTALGDQVGMNARMYTAKNHGLSSSILKPAKHLEIMPNIQFEGTEDVPLTTLDHCLVEAELEHSCDEMVIDVQGYELPVLRGAIQTLKDIKRLKVEVNRDELYEGCTQFPELKAFLEAHGFVCTLEDWYGKTWGDAYFEKP